MRFANSAVLFSFGFSALTANPAQFGLDSGDENYPAPAANTGVRHAGEPICAFPALCKSLQGNRLRNACVMTDHSHGTSIKVSK